jgi:hypothetical protein
MFAHNSKGQCRNEVTGQLLSLCCHLELPRRLPERDYVTSQLQYANRFSVNPLTLELNLSAQRRLTKFFIWDFAS